ncbi:MAG TPA: 1-deoxy-D-xylulose-5-phosphate synthase, partial [Treponema sp.]|nr:1-deoxy-D-xylulose-5-phosphate synthase [Treponema sp.]
IIEDIALQKRHVVLAMDRAGAVPSDGETHQGIFDIALLRTVPNLTCMTVASAEDLKVCMDWAVEKQNGPVSIRWPKLSCPSEIESFSHPVEVGRGLYIKCSEFAPALSAGLEENLFMGIQSRKRILFVCTGSMYGECLSAARSLLIKGIVVSMYVLRFLKPFDEDYFLEAVNEHNAVVFVEDGVRIGGIGEHLESLVQKSNEQRFSKTRTAVLAFPDSFVANGNRSQILEEAGLNAENIAETALNLV